MFQITVLFPQSVPKDKIPKNRHCSKSTHYQQIRLIMHVSTTQGIYMTNHNNIFTNGKAPIYWQRKFWRPYIGHILCWKNKQNSDNLDLYSVKGKNQLVFIKMCDKTPFDVWVNSSIYPFPRVTSTRVMKSLVEYSPN